MENMPRNDKGLPNETNPVESLFYLSRLHLRYSLIIVGYQNGLD